MTQIAVGVAKLLTIAKETQFAVAALATSGQLMRRTSSNVDLSKKTYKSTEIRPDYQRSDFRHGTRSITGSISDELSIGTFQLPMASVLRQAFQVAPTTAATAVTAQVAAPQIQRTAGSWLADGYNIGDVVRFLGFTESPTNNSSNFFITGITALGLTGIFLNSAAVVPDTTSTEVSCALVGKKSWIPLTGQTRDSYTIEHFFSDIGQSELFVGNRFTQMAIKLPSTGMATIDLTVMGINATEGTAQYFQNPAPVSTGAILAAVNGAVFMGGVQVAVITAMDFTLNGNMTSGDVVGSNIAPDIFPGAIDVTGTMSVYFEDATFQTAFFNEAEVSVIAALTTDSTATAGFQVFAFPRCKLNGATKNDGEVGIVQTVPFVALLNNNNPLPGTLVTTMSIQDSAAV